VQPDARSLGAREEAARRDEGLSPAALDVRRVLEALARHHPDATGPELVLMLARVCIWHRLKRRSR
jgi:hypothetical protein